MRRFWSSLISVGGVFTPGLPNFILQPSAINVPLPKVYTLEWTEPASTGNGETDFPPSDKKAMSVCDPQSNPALYKSAIDIIRLSNDYFVKSGCRSILNIENGYPKHEWVMELALQFSEEFKDQEYPLPPDLRILWVTDKDYHPSDRIIPWSNRLWVVACQTFANLNNDEKQILLERTEAEQQKLYAASFSDVLDYNDFLIDMFMTHLAHKECHLAKEELGIDRQPTNAELDAFFQECVSNNGITLYDLHRTFHNVQDIQALIRRVEYFAVFEPNPKTPFGHFDVPEGAYFRKPIPSTDQIRKALHEPMTLPQLFESLAEKYEEYAHGVGSQQQVLQQLIEIASPDVTTRNFILKDTQSPNEGDIWDALEDGPLSITDLAACFPNRIRSIENFTKVVSAMAYRVSAQDTRWIRMFLDEDDEPVGEEKSRKIYALQQMLKDEPLKVLDWTQRVATWDGEAFVDDTLELDNASDTEPDTEPEDKLEEELQIEPKAVTPSASPKRKRESEDDGEEARVSTPKMRAIKKARHNKGDLERCAYPQLC
ncbi:hypothetical protein P171DRAFT_480355 [Karstenula rhodostoma CBS 690.94]|uniref:Uncharacterized protein n=1 Tax=Karstenula rhodostoma CBS 690.94 TaxID=1392251 RepID=A0A9P4PQ47_9PLEO|nr:hypothetical protein P171DRAFT_480355 [Karstenula rhodostoma CBS 690.94]